MDMPCRITDSQNWCEIGLDEYGDYVRIERCGQTGEVIGRPDYPYYPEEDDRRQRECADKDISSLMNDINKELVAMYKWYGKK